MKFFLNFKNNHIALFSAFDQYISWQTCCNLEPPAVNLNIILIDLLTAEKQSTAFTRLINNSISLRQR